MPVVRPRVRPSGLYPTALGVHIFAGGFSLGIRNAGFELLGHLEDSAYGVETARRNLGIDVRVGADNWYPQDYVGKVDLLYSNPPCAIFSTAGISTSRGPGAWREDPRLGCWHRAWEVFKVVRPKVFTLESVCQAYTRGKELIDSWTTKAIGLGYSVYHVLINGQYAGVPQQRKRFFFVAALPHLPLEFRFDFANPLTVGEVLAQVQDHGEIAPSHFRNPDHLEAARVTAPGEKLRDRFDELMAARGLSGDAATRGRPGFLYGRLRNDTPMGAFLGDVYLHPDEDRYLGVNEMKALCGYPQDFWLEGKVGAWSGLLARAVLPPVGEWLARVVNKVVALPARTSATSHVTLVDIRKPPGVYTDLTGVYLPETTPARKELLDLTCKIKSCDACPRMRGRTRVFGQTSGPSPARVLFVGEAPGKDGAGLTGLPFYGDASGVTFDGLLKSIGLGFDDVFVTNSVLCNPLGQTQLNDAPTREERANCLGHLRETIRVVNPEVIVTVGAAALESLAQIEPHTLKLSSSVGRVHEFAGRSLVPVYHPSPRVTASVRPVDQQRQDWKVILKALGQEKPLSAPAPATIALLPPPVTQIAKVASPPRGKVITPLRVIEKPQKAAKATQKPPLDGSERPLEGEGSGKFIQRLWMTGKYSPDDLLRLVHTNWEGRTTKVGDVYYNYRKLIDSGVEGVPPWPGRNGTAVRREKGSRPAGVIPTPPAVISRDRSSGRRKTFLLTGSTPMQVGSEKTQLKIITAAASWKQALTQAGYEVDWRPVTPGEDVSRYTACGAILNKPNSISARYVHGAFWVLATRPDAVAFLDDWQTKELTGGLRSTSRVSERLFRLSGKDLDQPVKDEIFELVNRMVSNPWPWPVILPVIGKSELSKFELNAQKVGLDPTAFAHRYVHRGARPVKKRNWVKASLLFKEVDPRIRWPILGYGWKDSGRKGGGHSGKLGANAEPRVTEPELARVYLENWGVLSPAHPHAGSGWWRVRFLMSADAGCVLSACLAEAAGLGQPYLDASNPVVVEKLTDRQLGELAWAQKERLAEIVWPADQLVSSLTKVIDQAQQEQGLQKVKVTGHAKG